MDSFAESATGFGSLSQGLFWRVSLIINSSFFKELKQVTTFSPLIATSTLTILFPGSNFEKFNEPKVCRAYSMFLYRTIPSLIQ